MPFGFSVHGQEEMVANFRQASLRLPQIINAEMLKQMTMLADYVRTNKLSGNPLNRRTGRLSRSISGQSSYSGTAVTGVIGSKGVPYAHVHETGGTFEIPTYTRQIFGAGARKRREAVSTVQVRAHSATYPQRAFLKPALDEKREEILEALCKVATDYMESISAA